MDEDREGQMVMNFVSGVVLGIVIGAGIALLAAPDSGRKTRKRIRKAAGQLRETATDRWDDLSDELKGRVDEAVQGARKRFS